MRTGMRRSLFAMALILASAVLYATYQWGTTPKLWPSKALVRDDQPTRADAIIILMGGIESREHQAAQLYNQGIAPLIIFARTETSHGEALGVRLNDGDATMALLKKDGIPPERIHFLTRANVSSTKEEAETLFTYLHDHLPEVKSLIIVTDWYHTSRAGWIFSKVNHNGYQIYLSPAESPGNNPNVWLSREEAFLSTFNEYLKWLFYLLHY